MLTIILIVLLVLALGGTGWRWRAGGGINDPLGILFIVIILVLLFGLLSPWFFYSRPI
jgi:hypothetical protein